MSLTQTINQHESEVYLLGAILKFGATALDQILPIVKSPAYFFKTEHKLIYKKILETHKEGGSCESFSFIQGIDEKTMKEMGDRSYVVGLSLEVATESHIPTVCKKIRNNYLLQRLHSRFSALSGSALLEGADADELLVDAEKAIVNMAENIESGELKPASDFLPRDTVLRSLSFINLRRFWAKFISI